MEPFFKADATLKDEKKFNGMGLLRCLPPMANNFQYPLKEEFPLALLREIQQKLHRYGTKHFSGFGDLVASTPLPSPFDLHFYDSLLHHPMILPLLLVDRVYWEQQQDFAKHPWGLCLLGGQIDPKPTPTHFHACHKDQMD